MKITNEILQDYVDKKLISKKKHETFDYYIYDYTQRVQFDKLWDPITLMTRGLILNGKNKIIARPFEKFFNYEEVYQKVNFNVPFDSYEKADGSMGIAYLGEDGEIYFSTRGSFYSEQALEASKIFEETFSTEAKAQLGMRLHYGYTEIFEIIYPENRIVVDYYGKRMLKYLGSIENSTGKFYFRPDEYVEYVEKYEFKEDIDILKKQIDPEKEGYVIRFVNGLICKLKGEDYLRLHRLLTNVNAVNIWHCLKEKISLDSFLEKVPDEFYSWVKRTEKELKDKHSKLHEEILDIYREVKSIEEQKEFATTVNSEYKEFASFLFALRNKKDIDLLIWKQLKPEATKPFIQGTQE